MISSNDNIHFSRLVNSDPCCCSLTSEPLADQSYCGIIQVPYLPGCAEDMARAGSREGLWGLQPPLFLIKYLTWSLSIFII